MALLSLAFVAPDVKPETSFTDWTDCLLAYAQVQSSTSDTEITIAVHGLAQCEEQKDRYRKALMVSFEAEPISGFPALERTNAKLEQDESEIAVRTIAFVRRIRRG